MKKRIFSVIAVAIAVAGCDPAMQEKASLAEKIPATHTNSIPIKTAATEPLADGLYSQTLAGKLITLSVVDGQPIKYTWGDSYSTTDISRRGEMIQIDGAKFKILSNSPAKISGIYSWGGYLRRLHLTRK